MIYYYVHSVTLSHICNFCGRVKTAWAKTFYRNYPANGALTRPTQKNRFFWQMGLWYEKS